MTTGSGGPEDRLPMRWLLIATIAAAVFALAVHRPELVAALSLAIAVIGLLHMITGER